MGTFNDRTKVANTLIDILINGFWSQINDVIHFEYGYETHIETYVQDTLRLRKSKTAKHIRFAPDFSVYNKNSKKDFLFEYKVTLTPRYGFKDNQWNFGQIEADALDNYMNLINSGINVIVVIYCPYHSTPLLFGVPKEDWVHGSRQTPKYSNGSGTDFYNIDLRKLFDFKKHIWELIEIDELNVNKLLNEDFYSNLRDNQFLQTLHSKGSPYNSNEFCTGFNWSRCFL